MKKIFFFVFTFYSFLVSGQITIDETLTAQELVEDVLINSPCAEVSNISQKTGIPIFHETHRGRFSFHAATLIPYLRKFPEMELVYVDGNHTEEATLRYFEVLLQHKNITCIVFDDI